MSAKRPTDISSQVHADFARARSRAVLHDLWALLAGTPNSLLSYDEVKEKLRIGGPIYRGVRTVEVAIVAFVIMQAKEWFDAGQFDTPGTAADALLIAGGVLLVNAILMRASPSQKLTRQPL